MLFSVKQAFLRRGQIRAPLKRPAWEAKCEHNRVNCCTVKAWVHWCVEIQLGDAILNLLNQHLVQGEMAKPLTKVEIQPSSSVLFEQSKNIERSRVSELTAQIFISRAKLFRCRLIAKSCGTRKSSNHGWAYLFKINKYINGITMKKTGDRKTQVQVISAFFWEAFSRYRRKSICILCTSHFDRIKKLHPDCFGLCSWTTFLDIFLYIESNFSDCKRAFTMSLVSYSCF